MSSTRTRCETVPFAAYFLFFLTLLAPLHALDHTPHVWSIQSHLEDSDHHCGTWSHNQDLCQICKSSGQPGFCPMLVRISAPHTPCRPVYSVNSLPIEGLRLDATSGRSPPVV